MLGLALAVAVLYAAFANGSIGIPEESRLQVAVAVIALATLGGLLYGSGLRVEASPAAGWGLALRSASRLGRPLDHLVDRPRRELARAQPRADLRAGRRPGHRLGSVSRARGANGPCRLAIATVIAAYALGGKLFPGFMSAA